MRNNLRNVYLVLYRYEFKFNETFYFSSNLMSITLILICLYKLLYETTFKISQEL